MQTKFDDAADPTIAEQPLGQKYTFQQQCVEHEGLNTQDGPLSFSALWQTPPSRTFHTLKGVITRALLLDFQIILAVPIFVIIFVLFTLEFSIYFAVRVAGRSVEKWCTRPKVRRLVQRLRKATHFTEYAKIAYQLDVLTHRDAWKSLDDFASPHYISSSANPSSTLDVADCDPVVVRKKLEELRDFRETHQTAESILALKRCLDTKLYNTLQPSLYSMTFSGTAHLVEELQNEVVQSLNALKLKLEESPELLAAGDDRALPDDVLQQLFHISRGYGRTGLVLSGGAMLGLHHFGVLEALISRGCLPKVIAGTSAGAVVAAFVCTRSDEEILRFLQDPHAMEVFRCPFDPDNWCMRLFNFIKNGYTINVEAWLKRTTKLFGDTTFLEAFNRTGRVLNITTSRAGAVGESVVLNYRNAPNVLITTAVLASSAFPYLGCPIHLMEKDTITGKTIVSEEYSGRYYHDGSLRADVPANALRVNWNVRYVVVSQVNPHVFPFLGLRSHGTPGLPVRGWGSAAVWRGGFILALLEVVLKEHLRFLLRVLALLEIVPTVNGINVTHVTLQSYGGDLNIYPSRLAWPHIYLMNNVSQKTLEWFVQVGRQMVFPKMWLLKARMEPELALQALEGLVKQKTGRNSRKNSQWDLLEPRSKTVYASTVNSCPGPLTHINELPYHHIRVPFNATGRP